jgi:AcrR family transcriptional regulator
MRQRLTRAERQQQTRAELLAAAHRVFLRDGFHGASLTEIAEEAGYTFGAVYSNFQNKDDLFLAVMDAESQRRVPLHVDLLLDAASLEEGLRASAREYAQYAQQHPNWTAVYVEFWTHAARRPELRPGRRTARAPARHRDRAAGGVRPALGVEFAIPVREVVRGYPRAPSCRCGPTPIQVTPVPELPRDQGHGAKLKLIQTTAKR